MLWSSRNKYQDDKYEDDLQNSVEDITQMNENPTTVDVVEPANQPVIEHDELNGETGDSSNEWFQSLKSELHRQVISKIDLATIGTYPTRHPHFSISSVEVVEAEKPSGSRWR